MARPVTTSSAMSTTNFAQLLKLAKDKLAVAAITKVLEEEKPTHVDISSLGLGEDTTDEAVVEACEEVGNNILSSGGDVVLDSLNNNAVDSAETASTHQTIGVARAVTLNEKQELFVITALSGTSCVLIGSAGTGKTTSIRQLSRRYIDSGKLQKLITPTKWLKSGLYGAVILSFTNKAVNNIRHAVVDELKPHTITAHKLLEFKPVFFEIEDPENPGSWKKTMRFEPSKGHTNPLPAELQLLIWEESSMIGVPLYNMVQDAMTHKHQEIFLGDIQQLPPVFGLAVLGFKMLELPVVELTEIYRQAANSPIISLAHAILGNMELAFPDNPTITQAEAFSSKTTTYPWVSPHTGRTIQKVRVPALEAFNANRPEGIVTFQPWPKTIEAETAVNVFAKQCERWIEEGYYDPTDDIILCPFNKGFGTIEINKKIAQYLGTKRGAVVWEVLAGFNKHYLAVGDRVLYDKEDAIITNISHNGNYMGKATQIAATSLDRWGHHREELTKEEQYLAKQDETNRQEEALEDFFSAEDSVEDRVHQASHVVTVKLIYADEGEAEREIYLSTAAEINNLLGGYALTVHKYQGSESRTTFLALHASHATMVSRELLYTAVTRARYKLHIICETFSFERGVKSQRIQGNTLAEKAESFKGKANKGDDGYSTPVESSGVVSGVVTLDSAVAMLQQAKEVIAAATPAGTSAALRAPEKSKLSVAEMLAKLRATA